VQQRLTTFISGAHHSLIERLAAHIESGAVTPSVRAAFPLADAPQALDQLDAGKATGKTVIIVRNDGDDRVE
jgi:NADPH:quinone reductase-like Zn-dependent oxidoreductase